MRDGWVADSFEQAAREFGGHFVNAARFYVRHGLLRHPDFPTEGDVTAERMALYLVLGTPAQCLEHLQAAEEEREIDYVMLCCRVSAGPSLERTREQILRLGEEVVSVLHARDPGRDHPVIPLGCRRSAISPGPVPRPDPGLPGRAAYAGAMLALSGYLRRISYKVVRSAAGRPASWAARMKSAGSRRVP